MAGVADAIVVPVNERLAVVVDAVAVDIGERLRTVPRPFAHADLDSTTSCAVELADAVGLVQPPAAPIEAVVALGRGHVLIVREQRVIEEVEAVAVQSREARRARAEPDRRNSGPA